MTPPEVRRARDVAELRTWLVGELAPGGRLGVALHVVENVAERSHQNSPTSQAAEYRAMVEADLWYVPDDAVGVVEEAMASVPDDLTLDVWQMPSLCGFVVFERSIVGTDAQSATTIRVDGLLWGPVNIYDYDEARPIKALGISAWHHRTPASPVLQWAAMANEPVMNSRDYWVPLGRSDWEVGTSLVTMPPVYQRQARR